MPLFQSQENRRVRRRPRTKLDLIRRSSKKSKPTGSKLRRKNDDLNDEIQRLECFIASAPAVAKKKLIHRRDLVPPPDDYLADGKSYWEYRSRLTRGQAQVIRASRQKSLLRFLFLLMCFFGLLAWLSYWSQIQG